MALRRLRWRRRARPDRGHRGLGRLRLGRRLGSGGPLEKRAAARLCLLAAQHRHAAPARSTPIRGWSRPGAKPVDTYGCPTPNFADFDNDGDLDLLCGEFLDQFTYFENTGTRTAPRYAAGTAIDGAGRFAAGHELADDRADRLRLGPRRRSRPGRGGRRRPSRTARKHRQVVGRSSADVPAAALLFAAGRRLEVRGAGDARWFRLGRRWRHGLTVGKHGRIPGIL